MNPFSTLRGVRAYVVALFRQTGKKHVIFRVPPDTLAFAAGMKFGTCEIDERNEYAAAGAEFLPEEEQVYQR